LPGICIRTDEDVTLSVSLLIRAVIAVLHQYASEAEHTDYYKPKRLYLNEGKGLEPLLHCKTRGMAEEKAVVGSIPTVPFQ